MLVSLQNRGPKIRQACAHFGNHPPLVRTIDNQSTSMAVFHVLHPIKDTYQTRGIATRDGRLEKEVLFSRLQIMTMKNIFLPLCLVAGAATFTGCEKPVACEEGNKATLTITNLTVCTPDIKVNGDVEVSNFGDNTIDAYGTTVVIELDEGTYDIKGDLPLITACTERDTTIEAVCGGVYTWNFY